MFKRCFFILAPSFHGATIISKILNSHPEIISLGDTYPSNGFDQICGCGLHVSQCKFWQTVKDKVEAKRYQKYQSMLPYYPSILGGSFDRHIYNLFSPRLLSRLLNQKQKDIFFTDYITFLKGVYDLQATGKEYVFVDGVKSISRVLALIASGMQVDGVIHLVRDPCDFVKSSMKNSKNDFNTLVDRAFVYRLYHQKTQRLRKFVPYLKLDYEAVTDDTNETLQRLFEFMAVDTLSMESLLGDMNNVWHFMGNASLFKFQGSLRRSRHKTTEVERRCIKFIIGKSLANG